ncbi:protein-disulfide reductase DsbD [Photobacterium sp. ZSDE20]|uniref:Thiol:disulfide interchange protein DsbD n=1 Tax=Photobacterium pectinilyticum TaxID=2906793 RepID=A0ABT1N3S1_9GAMM|nr:protein-disulfide reductase DsbD [Photobacterium sp. ZSDE20]MCQ1059365.1 protein-disulfide reductase DsbD [Photobacterium sp. ZSDE20]MDD1825071.1 protein-disulfide reductase DsbD [Photobacterium sp. ZSDE20]
MTLLQILQCATGQFALRRTLSLLAILSLLVISLPASALKLPGFNSPSNTFVAVDEAFSFNFTQQGEQVFLDWQIKPGYYLYQHQLSVSSESATLGNVNIPAGKPYQDEFFGEVNIYTEPLTLTVPIVEAANSDMLIVRYQGCAEAGFCYPPEIRQIPLSAVMVATNAALPTTGSQPVQLTDTQSNVSTYSQKTLESSIPASEQDKLASDLAEQWWTPLVFLALGIGLAFTPCVLPMYPILSGIVLGNGQLSHGRAFRLAFIYVQGMALTYTLLGLVVASAGMQFQAALQHPYILIGLSILFVALALSMFGVYTLQLPSGFQTWLNGLSNKQQGGSSGGVFAMGAISGLVCSPCTTAPLSGALIYVAQSGDLLTGAVALYALAIGMGIPLILAAMFGNKLLPKAGSWMNHVKALFGFVLLAVPLFLLERILPAHLMPYLWSLLGIAAFGWLYHVKNTLAVSWRSSALAVVAIVGLFISVQPLYPLLTGSTAQHTTEQATRVEFKRVSSIDDLTLALEEAKALQLPVMLDFYADWCVACKEFEKYTFHDPAVAKQLGNFVLLQADVTQSSPTDIELLQAMDVLGLPTLDFWDSSGNRMEGARLTGFMKSEPFLAHLANHQLIR